MSIKEHIITLMSRLVNDDAFKGNDLLLVTANGLIYGTPVLIDDNDKIELPVTKFVKVFSDIYYRDYDNNNENTSNDGFICLEKVHIRTGTVVTTLPELTVFFDQIIAIAISNDRIK